MNRPNWRMAAAFWAAATLPAYGQQQPFVERPTMIGPIRSYMAPTIPGVRMTNSDRLYSLIRAGNLYLSLEDALALAIENNLNLEIDRYGPLLQASALERAKGGGPFRGVPRSNTVIASVDSGLGVAGSTLAAGLTTGSSGGGGGSGTNTVIQQVGIIAPNFDAVMQGAESFSHLTTPYANTVVAQTESLIQSQRVYSNLVQQGLVTGGIVQVSSYEQYLKENAPSDVLEPQMGSNVALVYYQPWLQQFGIHLNDYQIRIARINADASREAFRAQLVDLVASVSNSYWDYVNSRDELKLRQRAFAITQKFRDDTRYEISLGALAGVELPRAEAEVASRRQDLAIAQATMRQRSTTLKEALSHTEDPALEAAEIIPLDHIEVPEVEEPLPALRQLLTNAMEKRPDVAMARFRDQTDEISLLGTTNPLLPTLYTVLRTYDRGVAGTPQASGGQAPPGFVGQYGTALGQIFRRDFGNESAAISFSAPIGNRAAQGDYGIDQLKYRQGQLQSQRDNNQILVEISSGVIALRQARARYETARESRVLQEQLLAAEQQKSYGTATFNYIMIDQRALIAAQLAELAATSAYARTRVMLDQTLGQTLEKNRITLEEGLNGRVNRSSRIPDVPPARPVPAGPAPAGTPGKAADKPAGK
ncbi:MAG TPA: TolC family protein [Bryobacteraceae bacterium]|nr:TolC family protein [Bryobacteraceae bacterium]